MVKRKVHMLTHESFYNKVEDFRRDFEKRNMIKISTIKATEILARNMIMPKIKITLGRTNEKQKRRRI